MSATVHAKINILKMSRSSANGKSLEIMMAEMNTTERHETLLSFMLYPKTEKLRRNDSPICTCNYSCKQERCDFSEALKCMKRNVDIKAYGSQQFLEEVIYISTNSFQIFYLIVVGNSWHFQQLWRLYGSQPWWLSNMSGGGLICYDCNESMTAGNRPSQLELVN